jgi:allophanate hydrolase
MRALRAAERFYRDVVGIGQEVFIALVPEEQAYAAAARVDAEVDAGVDLPLAGLIFAVKDNIDVLGVSTTAGCPDFAYLPERSATCIELLQRAGAVVVAKSNLDQFATGLVGTRSPYGAPTSVLDPSRISGGSSSGSAVAVALGLVDIALGTDTAGSGRVPAAFNGIVGMKPTRGLVSLRGVVPACNSVDCVSVFARDIATARLALDVIARPDDEDPMSRSVEQRPPRVRQSPIRIGIASRRDLEGLMTSEFLDDYERSIVAIRAAGHQVETIEVDELLATGRLLYEGAIVAERFAAVGEFVVTHRDAVDPVVGSIIERAGSIPAHELARDLLKIAASRRRAAAVFARVEAVALPTVPEHPTPSEVAADPIGVNTRLGRFTTFCNLVDWCALALPAPGAPDLSTFGITLFGPAFADGEIADIGAVLNGETDQRKRDSSGTVEFVVVGAHLSGQPLNSQLTDRGGRMIATTHTSNAYRLFALVTDPPRPGLVRVAPESGGAIEVECWSLGAAGFAAFLGDVASPLAIGPVELIDGRILPGFVLAASEGPSDARDITEFGGWRGYLGTRTE